MASSPCPLPLMGWQAGMEALREAVALSESLVSLNGIQVRQANSSFLQIIALTSKSGDLNTTDLGN